MGLEGGRGIANSVPDCLSFVQGPGTDLGNLTWWPNCKHSLGEAVIVKGESSYRRFLERHFPGEGSYRRFFGRVGDELPPILLRGILWRKAAIADFSAEWGDQLSPILGEAFPGGRQLPPILGREIVEPGARQGRPADPKREWKS